MNAESYLLPGNIGGLQLRNRLIRAATAESMASDSGAVTAELVAFYRTLARGGAGLLITGHMYVERRGRYNRKQTAICGDEHVQGLKQLTRAVHQEGGLIFAELAHAGSQSLVEADDSIAPSVVPNAMWNRSSREMSEDDIETTLAAFGAAARRALDAGFDGVHLHGGNGYLISQFASPVSNRRTDGWGGDSQRRWRFLGEVYQRVRQAVGGKVPVTARIGIADGVADGVTSSEGVTAVSALRARGLDAVEPTLGLMASYLQNVRPYVAIGWARAVRSLIVPRLWTRAAPEAYYRVFARQIKRASDIPVIVVGGVRSTAVMADILDAGEADFLALARPFIREPDLPNQLARGRKGKVDCVSCNICLSYDGKRPVQCWRSDLLSLARHGWHQIVRVRA